MPTASDELMQYGKLRVGRIVNSISNVVFPAEGIQYVLHYLLLCINLDRKKLAEDSIFRFRRRMSLLELLRHNLYETQEVPGGSIKRSHQEVPSDGLIRWFHQEDPSGGSMRFHQEAAGGYRNEVKNKTNDAKSLREK